MKTITQILNEMILENTKKIEKLEKQITDTNNYIIKTEQNNIDNTLEQNKYITDVKNRIFEIQEKLIKKVKKITFLLSIATIINAISIIILNLWR